MKVKLLLTALLLASLSMEAQAVNPTSFAATVRAEQLTADNVGPTSFAATVCAEQLMADNVSPAYMVGWAKDVKGQDIPAAQAPIASHVTSLLIDASDVPGTVGSIAVYAAGKEAIAGPMVFDGEHVDVLQGGSASVYASSGQSDVVLVKGESKTCTAYLLPVDLPQGVMVTVHTTDGKYYSQSFSQPISGGASLPLKVTVTTASQLWMATLPGNTYLSYVSTPGAHNACTSGLIGASECQGESLEGMLANGVRAFDLRPNYNNSTTITADNLYIAHGATATKVKYVDAIKTLADFVRAHPSEAVSVVMVKENGPGNQDRSAEMWAVMNACHSEYADCMKLLDHSYYTLDDFRGKICYINRTGTECTNTTRITGWPDDNTVSDYACRIGGTCYANVQDMYNTSGEAKYSAIEAMLQRSSQNTEKKNFHYNFCSTAWSLLGSNPATYAKATNLEIAQYLNAGSIAGPTGYVYADFISSSAHNGTALLSAIVEQNYRYAYQGRTKEDLSATDANWDLSLGSDVAWTKGGNWADSYGTQNGEVHVTENYAGYWSQEQTDFSLLRSVMLPAGTYRLSGYGLYRDGTPGSTKMVAKVGDRTVGSVDVAPLTALSTVGANDLEKAANSFTGNEYLNTLYFVLPSPAEVTMGYEGRHTGMRQWFVAGPMCYERIDRVEASEELPADVTCLIANPTIFNLDNHQLPKGWTQYARVAGNANYTTGTGDTMMENWHGSPANARFDYYQTLYLPAGKYTLGADILYRGGQGDEVGLYAYDVATQARVSASPSVVDAELHTVTLDFTTTGGETNIGFINLNTMTGDWFAIDNFTLTYYGPQDEARPVSIVDLAQKIEADRKAGIKDVTNELKAIIDRILER